MENGSYTAIPTEFHVDGPATAKLRSVILPVDLLTGAKHRALSTNQLDHN